MPCAVSAGKRNLLFRPVGLPPNAGTLCFAGIAAGAFPASPGGEPGAIAGAEPLRVAAPLSAGLLFSATRFDYSTTPSGPRFLRRGLGSVGGDGGVLSRWFSSWSCALSSSTFFFAWRSVSRSFSSCSSRSVLSPVNTTAAAGGGAAGGAGGAGGGAAGGTGGGGGFGGSGG